MIDPAKLTRALAQANGRVERCQDAIAYYKDPERRPPYMIQRELNAEIECSERVLRDAKTRALRLQRIIWKARQHAAIRKLLEEYD